MGRRLKAVTDKPVLLGIGISTAEQAVEAAQFRRRRHLWGARLVARLLPGWRSRRRPRVRGRAPRPRSTPSEAAW